MPETDIVVTRCVGDFSICRWWGSWAFQVDDVDKTTRNIQWHWGGFQEARGDSSGAEWCIENIFEECDSPNEWFWDATSQMLYYSFNGTVPLAIARQEDADAALGQSLSFPSYQAGRRLDTHRVTLDVADPSPFYAAQIENLFTVTGTPTNPVYNVTISGFTLTHTTLTYMKPYIVGREQQFY